MGGAACTRLEACSPAIVPPPRASSSQSSFQHRATSSTDDADSELPRLCGSPSMMQAEKLLLTPSRKRTRTATRLTAELPSGCREIDRKEVHRGTKIGSGTWSLVFAAEWRGEKAAMKVFRHAGCNPEMEEKRWQMFLKEAKMLLHLDSPRMVKLMGVFMGGDGCPCLVMELLQGGVLHEWLHGRRKSHKFILEPAHRFLLGAHVAEGIAYLHGVKPPVVHRDLKSKNVMVVTKFPEAGPPCEAKIIDFGLADYLDETSSTEKLPAESGLQGSAVYMAPECFVQPFFLSTKVDIWALGCVLAEIFGGAPPHAECENLHQVVDKLLVQKRAPDVPAHADLAAGAPDDDSIKKMLEACFEIDVEKRWSAEGVLEKLKALAADRGFIDIDFGDTA